MRHAGELLRDECVAELGDRHDVDAIAPLELDYGVRVGRLSRDLSSSVVAPVVRRNWSDISPLPCSAADTCALLGASDRRMVQPIFRCAATPGPMNRARVERMKLPSAASRRNENRRGHATCSDPSPR